jgi:hypothetical protein
MKISRAVPTELTPGGLIEGALRGRKKRLYRVIDWNENLDCVWLVELTAKRPQSAMPVPWVLSRVAAAIGTTANFVAEKVKLPDMTLANSSLSRSAREQRNRRLRLLGCLIWRANHTALCDSKLRGQLIARRAAATGISAQYFYKLLTVYFWFGLNWNALLPLRAQQGALGKARPGGTKKSGRPNSHQQLGRKYRGVTVGKHDLAIFKVALIELYIDKDWSLHATYTEMAEQRYLRRRTKDGNVETIHIRAEKIPTYEQFLYHARKMIEENGWKAEKHGELDYNQHHATYGGNSTDYSLYPGDVFDGDCTTFKVECQLYTGQKHLAIRQKTIAFWIDRSSYAVVGFFAFSGPESWDVYRQALFVAFTAKDELCEAAGVSPKLWAIRHKCNKIFVDRGPARGNQAYEAVVERLGLGRAVAPARAAQMKSAIENFQGCIQKELSNLPGGKRRTKRIRDKDNYDKVIKGPLPTSQELNDCIVRAIAQHNNFMDASHLRTSKMLRDGTPPNPAEIFKWGIKYAAGEYNRVISDTEIYRSLLHSKPVSVQAEGIEFRGAWFQCNEIRAYREARHIRGPSPRIDILFDPLRRMLYWENEAGELIGIPMKTASAAKFEEMTLDDMEDFRLYERVSVVTQKLNKRNTKLLTSKQAEVANAAAKRFAETTPEEQRAGVASSKENKAAERRSEESRLRAQQKRLMAFVENTMDAAMPDIESGGMSKKLPRTVAGGPEESNPRALFLKLMAERKEGSKA